MGSPFIERVGKVCSPTLLQLRIYTYINCVIIIIYRKVYAFLSDRINRVEFSFRTENNIFPRCKNTGPVTVTSHAVYDMKCLHPLERWDRVFEFHSRHRCLFGFILCWR
jgi:hypothetical protein